ncbi:sensor histidine kinase [Microvirga sp. 2YAF29]|uniref:sensor histidine kinase n=1 Tax=Microvirga sp. 2YAF29 TaxID=3233031 RepID=UPI003F983294
MNKSETIDADSLLKRLEMLERENRALRGQLQEQSTRSAAVTLGHEAESRERDRAMTSATSRIDRLEDSHTFLEASEKRLRDSEKKLREITDNIPALIAYVDAEQRYRFNNKAYQTWMGRSPESFYGVTLLDVVGEKAYSRVKPYIETALGGQRTNHEWWAPLPGGLRYVRSEYIPDFSEDGNVAGFYVLASDLTESKRSQEALTASEGRLKLAIDAARMAIWESDNVTRTIKSSPELNQLLGFPPDASPTTEEIQGRYSPGERKRLHQIAREAISRDDRYVETELQIIWPDGSLHWLLLRAELLGDASGLPTRAVGVALDITERKKAEDHQRLLINELNHRVKNTLTTVQSITTQSLRNAETAAGARDAVEGRLFALSRAHDVLTRENWDGAYLREVVHRALEPFQAARGDRFDVSGADIRLPPRIALALAMAIQELGTNAVKYGALSSEDGRIAIDWTVVGERKDQKLFDEMARGRRPTRRPSRAPRLRHTPHRAQPCSGAERICRDRLRSQGRDLHDQRASDGGIMSLRGSSKYADSFSPKGEGIRTAHPSRKSTNAS